MDEEVLAHERRVLYERRLLAKKMALLKIEEEKATLRIFASKITKVPKTVKVYT